MGFLVAFMLVLSSPFASAEDCVLESKQHIPQVFLIGVGQPQNWKPEGKESFNTVNDEIRLLRARSFKEARTQNLPLLSQSYISLDGRETGPYLELVKAKYDGKNRIYGIESEWAMALKSNYELMSHYYRNIKTKLPFSRLQRLYFLTLKYPKLKLIWDEMYTKAEVYKIGDLQMTIRRINNAINEYETKRGSLTLIGKVSAPYRVRNYFKQRIRKPLEKNENADAIAEKLLMTFHERLVEHVNKAFKTDFRFFGPRDQKNNRLSEILNTVQDFQEIRVGDLIRKHFCSIVDRPAVLIWAERSFLATLEKRIQSFDTRLKVESFDTFQAKGRKRIYKALNPRWSKRF